VNVTANGTSITNTAIVTFTPDAATHYAVSASNTAPAGLASPFKVCIPVSTSQE
jgi:hypothetical protein